jgi:hypothetical protein
VYLCRVKPQAMGFYRNKGLCTDCVSFQALSVYVSGKASGHGLYWNKGLGTQEAKLSTGPILVQPTVLTIINSTNFGYRF